MARNVSRYRNRAYMSEICEELGRPRETIVYWDVQGMLPKRLVFKRDENGWRYWTHDQLEYAREWVTGPEQTAPIRGRHKSRTVSAT